MTTSEPTGARQDAFRSLPSVEEVLLRPTVLAHLESLDRETLTSFVRAELDDWRRAIRAERLDREGVEQRLGEGALEAGLAERVAREGRRGVQRVVNATGVVLHTGLGRSPVHPEVAAAMGAAAGSYCVLEVDRDSGERNERDGRLSELLARLTGAEAGIAVNNCAAAALLTLASTEELGGRGREVIVSRGELVEIGGSFRVPDVMSRAGVELVEVGTTNRTRITDYERAIRDETGMLMKVHRSNFRLVGFQEEVEPAELAALGRRTGVPTAFDLGSGQLEVEGLERRAELGDEPLVQASVASGVDLVMFSGDKLLGAPQAGLIVGRKAAVRACRKNALYRALRLDKSMLAGLEKTCELYLSGRGDELPARALMARTADEMRAACEGLARELKDLNRVTVEIVAERSQPGSGSAPGVFLDTFAPRLTPRAGSVGDLATDLRRGEPAVFGRIQDGALLLDPRTLLTGDEQRLVDALRRADTPS